ncbi:hypothetical protein AG1IA_10421 [Rhizoctonia solani AG-1 IA]|uniref:Uncharacterized protein n=1 Tax=Thanatephorus cucumeris (strain AG1-IA) TaxID=983506 RepID=L8WGM3_THACA|nr:hypothetical protein AG1IA_10421 [Rhizoctonia solani AG-1 IA]
MTMLKPRTYTKQVRLPLSAANDRHTDPPVDLERRPGLYRWDVCYLSCERNNDTTLVPYLDKLSSNREICIQGTRNAAIKPFLVGREPDCAGLFKTFS